MKYKITTYICVLSLVLLLTPIASPKFRYRGFLCPDTLTYPLEQMATQGCDQDGKGSMTNNNRGVE
jgi:hypothetical protein